MKKPALGRGLEALLGDAKSVFQPVEGAGHLKYLSSEQLKPGPFQPRRDFDPDKLGELVESIKAQGIVQPIVVRPDTSQASMYQIIAGERRWRAAKMAGLGEVPVVIRDVDDQAVLAIGLIENIQRQDLNPLEECEALRRLQVEFGMTHQQIADIVGKSRASVTNLLRINEVSEEVKNWMREGKLDMGHARALLTLEENQQNKLAQHIVNDGLSVRATESMARKWLETGDTAKTQARAERQKRDADTLRLEQRLSLYLGTEVQLQSGKQGQGKMIVHFSGLDQLQGILERIGEPGDAV